MKQMNNSPVVVTYNEQPIATELYLEEEVEKSSEKLKPTQVDKVKISDKNRSEKIKPDKIKVDKIKTDKSSKSEKTEKIRPTEKSKFEGKFSDSDDSPVA